MFQPFLDKILKNVLKNRKNKKLISLVIGDKKTPSKTKSYCRKMEKNIKLKLSI